MKEWHNIEYRAKDMDTIIDRVNLGISRRKVLLGGLAAIIASGKSPAAIIRSNVGGVRTRMIESEGGWVNPYVTDGLVAMWDAIENVGMGIHNPSSDTWIDVIGGAAVEIVNPYPNKIHMAWRDRCFCYDDTYEGAFSPGAAIMMLTLTPELVDIYNNGIGTFEMCAFLGANAIGHRMYTPVGWYDNTAYIYSSPFFTNALNFNVSSMSANKGTATVNNTGLFLNGVKKRTVALTIREHTYADGEVITFCSRGNYDGSSKRFCCIRFYNRDLTNDEIAYNYSIDKERFGI